MEDNKEKNISLKAFLGRFAGALKRKVVSGFSPLWNPEQEGQFEQQADHKLAELLRQPFEAQRNAIIALARGFLHGDKRGLVLTAEMGTGKTICAISVAHLIHQKPYRALVMCPPHLVQKWIREIEITLPRCAVINLNGKGIADLESLQGKGKPLCAEWYVLGRERAKLHHQWKKSLMRQKHLERMLCPRCGKEVRNIKGDRPTHHCGEALYEADRSGTRRFAKAEYIKRQLPKGFFDLFVADEVHELKGGTTAQGQALANLASCSKRTLALTGTLMGGYATNLFYLLWRLMPRKMAGEKIPFNSPMGFAERYGIIERTQIEKRSQEYGSASIGRSRSTRTIVKEKPGVSPLILTRFLLEHAVFMRLYDVCTALPAYEEEVIEVEMGQKQEAAYAQFEKDLLAEVSHALAKGDHSLLGALVNSLLGYPDGARRGEVVCHPRTGELVAGGPQIPEPILPKEESLLRILDQELKEGRKCLVCLEHTGTRDLIPDLMERIECCGLRPFALRSTTVATEKREQWVKDKMALGAYDVMIANPRLIQTGLDLLEFPTLIFFQTGYSIFTLRQASRRSWRIGQSQPVKVFYMAYRKTMQATALSLIATKLETALAVEGDLSDRGLTILAEGSNSMLIEMARSLTGERENVSVSAAWNTYKRAEMDVDSFLIEVPEDVETTTTITRGNRTARVTHRIERGVIYPRNGYAVGYVDNVQFVFKNGAVLFNDRVVGEYAQKGGRGCIGQKPIQIAKAGNRFVLFELREIEAELEMAKAA